MSEEDSKPQLEVVPDKAPSVIRKFLDNCEDSVDLVDGFVVNWSRKGVGFGQLYFWVDSNGNTRCESETMSRAFVKEVMNDLVDSCIMDD